MVEFGLLAPVVFLLLLGVVVLAIVVTNQIQLTNAVRDAARAAAVCGGLQARGGEGSQAPTLPDGVTRCDSNALIAYIKQRLSAVAPGAASLSVCVQDKAGVPCVATDPNVMDQCARAKIIEVDASYPQPLFVPLVGALFADNVGANTRTLSARAEATCEQ